MTTTIRSSAAMPIAAALIAMCCIQAGASVAKGLFPIIGPAAATTLRLGLACLMMLAIWRPWRSRVAPEHRRFILAYGISLGCMNALFYAALSRIPLGVAVALEFTGPLGVALLASRRPSDYLWVALAITGVVLLLPISVGAEHLDTVGVAFALGAGVFWAAYIVFGQRAGAGGSGPAVAYGSLIATIVVAPLGIAQSGLAMFAPSILPAAVAMALLSSAIPYSLEMMSMTRLSAKTFGVLMSVEPGIGAIAGLILLKERLSMTQVIAILLIVVASVGTVATHESPQPVSG